jgi:hypothetical protein
MSNISDVRGRAKLFAAACSDRSDDIIALNVLAEHTGPEDPTGPEG